MPAAPSDARTAAAVAYRPAHGVPPEFAALRETLATPPRFYELTSLDGRQGLAAYVPATDRDAPLVLSVHGSGGSIVSEPVRTLVEGLSRAGHPVLAVNTRQSGDAVNTDNFYATVRDIEAAHWMARDLGHERIVLHGHSLGTSQVTFFAATHWHTTTLGVVLTGMFADLPWKSRHLLINDESRYHALGDEAVAAVRSRAYGQVLADTMPWLGGSSMPVSAEHFLTYRAEGVAGARTVEWIRRVPYPLLLIRDQNDSVIHDFEPGWLRAALEGGLTPSATFVSLPSAPPCEGHRFEGSRTELVKTVAGWLADLDRPAGPAA